MLLVKAAGLADCRVRSRSECRWGGISYSALSRLLLLLLLLLELRNESRKGRDIDGRLLRLRKRSRGSETGKERVRYKLLHHGLLLLLWRDRFRS